jgi:hypothetical protein
MIAEIFETLFYGFLATAFLGFVGTILYVLFCHPIILAALVGLLIFLYGVGWLLQNSDHLVSEISSSKELEPVDNVRQYGVPVLDRLEQFEAQYHLSTVHFMSFVYNDWIPAGMNNLDYLEWISLANDLSSITLDKNKKKKGK